MAVNPVTIPCAAGVWVKVAAGVTVGTIYRLSTIPAKYVQAIRVKDDPAPTDNSDAALIFEKSSESAISSDTQIDVYVKSITRDGSVRVDL